MLAYDEIAVEAVIPAPKGQPAGGYLKLERRVGDFATVGVAVAIERSGASVDPGGHRAHRRGRLHDRRQRGRPGPRRRAADAPTASREAAELAAQAARPRTDHRGSASFKRHIVRTFVVRILDRVRRADEKAA